MGQDQRERLRRGIAQFGLVDPIIVRRSDRLVIGGHQRLSVAIELGFGTVPVVYLDGLNDAAAAALNILLNNPQAQGEWDFPRLTDILSELDANGFDATLTGFDTSDLTRLLAPVSGILDGVDLDDAPEPPTEPITKPGDLIVLGRHRVVCGDSTDANVWESAMGGGYG